MSDSVVSGLAGHGLRTPGSLQKALSPLANCQRVYTAVCTLLLVLCRTSEGQAHFSGVSSGIRYTELLLLSVEAHRTNRQ